MSFLKTRAPFLDNSWGDLNEWNGMEWDFFYLVVRRLVSLFLVCS